MSSDALTSHELDPLLTLPELALRLGVTRQTLYDSRSQGRGPDRPGAAPPRSTPASLDWSSRTAAATNSRTRDERRAAAHRDRHLDLVELWLADPQLHDLTAGTRESYRDDLRVHVVPMLEHCTLGEITTELASSSWGSSARPLLAIEVRRKVRQQERINDDHDSNSPPGSAGFPGIFRRRWCAE